MQKKMSEVAGSITVTLNFLEWLLYNLQIHFKECPIVLYEEFLTAKNHVLPKDYISCYT